MLAFRLHRNAGSGDIQGDRIILRRKAGGLTVAASESYIPNAYSDVLAGLNSRRRPVSRALFRGAMVCAEVMADFLTCAIAIVAAYFLQLHFGGHIQYPMQKVVAVSMVHGLLAVLLLQSDGAYGGGSSLLRIRETERAVRISIQSLFLLLLVSFLLKLNFPRTAVMMGLGLVPVLLIVQKQLFASMVRLFHSKGYGADRVVVCGSGEAGRRVTATLLYSPRLGLRPVAVIGDDSVPAGDCMFELGYRRCHSVPVQCGPITPALLKSLQCHLLIVAMPQASTGRLTEVIRIADQAGSPVALLPGLAVQEKQWAGSIDIDGVLLASSIEPSAPWHYTLAKRVVDVTVSLFLLVSLAPFFGLTALLIRMGSAGPALFVQKRVGRNGKLFNMFKFRSMHTSAPKYDVSPSESSDPRITRLGRILRRTSMDELPQLINVFLGEMSLVGPRPEMPFVVDGYSTQQRRRLQVTPGITGLWQLSADRAFPIHENIEYDLYYIKNRTFFMDVAILMHTLLFAVGGGV
jgi:exopolysaccharide biosynthesis polyprenyl glycosylphosphotransferase